MQQSIKQISTALELEYGHPVIIVPGTRNVVFVVPGELEAYKLAYHLLTAGTRCSLAHGFEANAWHVTCPDYMEPPPPPSWQVGDVVRWQYQKQDGTIINFVGTITTISHIGYAECHGRDEATGDYWRDDVPLDKLEKV